MDKSVANSWSLYGDLICRPRCCVVSYRLQHQEELLFFNQTFVKHFDTAYLHLPPVRIEGTLLINSKIMMWWCTCMIVCMPILTWISAVNKVYFPRLSLFVRCRNFWSYTITSYLLQIPKMTQKYKVPSVLMKQGCICLYMTTWNHKSLGVRQQLDEL